MKRFMLLIFFLGFIPIFSFAADSIPDTQSRIYTVERNTGSDFDSEWAVHHQFMDSFIIPADYYFESSLFGIAEGDDDEIPSQPVFLVGYANESASLSLSMQWDGRGTKEANSGVIMVHYSGSPGFIGPTLHLEQYGGNSGCFFDHGSKYTLIVHQPGSGIGID